jgi:hypothetical protein
VKRRTGWLASCTGLALTLAAAAADERFGMFLQLNRDLATRDAAAWREDFDRMKAIGVARVLVQWTAEVPISYVRCDLPFAEQYDVVPIVLAEAERTGMEVYLGLQSDRSYWTRITAPDVVLRDYFYVRVAANERLQDALLERFATNQAWTGYYIPDEIDDVSWRTPERGAALRRYLQTLVERLRSRDTKRHIAVSAFFRTRTSPLRVAGTFGDLVAGTGVQHLLLQDGAGEENPPAKLRNLYATTIRGAWTNTVPDLWAVAEVFRRTDAGTNATVYTAESASPAEVAEQIRIASASFTQTVFFAYHPYIDPKGNGKASTLYDWFRDRRR